MYIQLKIMSSHSQKSLSVNVALLVDDFQYLPYYFPGNGALYVLQGHYSNYAIYVYNQNNLVTQFHTWDA